MTRDEIVEAVKSLGSEQDIAAQCAKLKRREKVLDRVMYAGLGLVVVCMVVAVAKATTPLGMYAMAVPLFLVSLAVLGCVVSSVFLKSWENFAPLAEIRNCRQALELVAKSEQARLVRDAVVELGRPLVGHDFYLMRNLCRVEEQAKSTEQREAEERALSLQLNDKSFVIPK